jgi:DNA polymerase-3 subunit epsilon/CBS domain-containing protein
VPQSSHSTPLLALDGVVLDTETTGLDARSARIVQIAAIRLTQGSLRAGERFESLVNPATRIPKAATAIHGITDEAVAAAPPFSRIAPELEAFAGRSIVIGHTIHYDLTVLEREYALARLRWPGFRALDVRALARLAAPSLADYSLERICEWLDISIRDRHSAAGDAEAAGKVFLALVPLLRAKNIRTLAEAEAASRALAEREALTAGGHGSPAQAAANDTRVLARIDSFPYRHTVRDLMSAPALFAAPTTTVREAVRLLIDKRISSVFVRTETGETGIATERDLLRAIDEGGEAALSTPIAAIMKAPLQTVAEDAFLYRAIGRIERLGFRHLGVRNAAGEIVGAVTTRNLLRHRATTAIALGDEIDSAMSTAALAAAWAKLPLMARSLMDEAVDPRTIAAVVSSEICAMTRRAAQLGEERLREEGLGAPPVPFAVLVLGSAGRGESQLAADQDNAIVYAEGSAGGREDAYFARLGEHMSDILDAAGVPYCRGGVMARNGEWRKSVADWRVTIEGWVRQQRPADLLNVDIFFDAVPVHGEASLGDTIWNHAYDRAHAAPDFQNLMIELARQRDRPFTLLGGFRLDERGRMDLKKFGLMPIFTSARVLSIKHDVRARSTADRIDGAAAKGIGTPETARRILDAHRLILGAVISQQLVDAETGVPLSPRVALARFDKAQKAELKQALGAVDEAIDLVAEGRL